MSLGMWWVESVGAVGQGPTKFFSAYKHGIFAMRAYR